MLLRGSAERINLLCTLCPHASQGGTVASSRWACTCWTFPFTRSDAPLFCKFSFTRSQHPTAWRSPWKVFWVKFILLMALCLVNCCPSLQNDLLCTLLANGSRGRIMNCDHFWNAHFTFISIVVYLHLRGLSPITCTETSALPCLFYITSGSSAFKLARNGHFKWTGDGQD